MRRSVAVLVVASLSLGGLAQATPALGAGPTTWTYPGTCPKSATGLQVCVDNANPGDIVELTSEINDEGVLISKSLTLRPDARGLDPILDSVGLNDSNGQDTITVRIEGIRVRYGITGNFDHGPSTERDDIRIRDVEVGKGIPASSPGKGIQMIGLTPVSLTVTDSYVRNTAHQTASIQLYVDTPTGDSRFRVVGDRIDQHGDDDAGSGIEAEMFSGGHMDVELYNDRIWDVVHDDAGGASGIMLYPDGTSTMRAEIIGNTIDQVGANGILVRDAVVAPGRVTADVFDNVVSHTVRSAIVTDATVPGTLTFLAGHNARYANGAPNELGGFSAGSGNLKVNPGYRDRSAGDLRLKSSSPLIDAGVMCPPGGVAQPDAAGHARWAGSTVDIGAYETGAGAPTGVIRLGTSGGETLSGSSGRDILCGFGGKDTLKGGAGPDYLDGGSGKDRLIGGTGGDRLYGDSDDNTLCARDGTHGNDHLNGGSGTDKGQSDSGDTRSSVERTTTC